MDPGRSDVRFGVDLVVLVVEFDVSRLKNWFDSGFGSFN